MQFKKVPPKPDFGKLEKKILAYWEKNKTFEKSVEKGVEGVKAPQNLKILRGPQGGEEEKARRKNFVFYEGPPTANGKPGVHHIEARSFKDLFPRYKTMQGYRVQRKAGWDTHGLPVELEVEKNLGFSGKRDIEKYGIERFNKKCEESVWKYKKDWEELTRRIGFWIDLQNPYITCDNDYIESVWWIVKQVWEKGLLYQGHKVVPYCPRCGTALSSHEVAQGYKKVKEESVFIKFKVKSEKLKVETGGKGGKGGEGKDVYFLVWTTTPWTLPGNVALALGEDIDYVLVEEANKAPQPKGDHTGSPLQRTMEPTARRGAPKEGYGGKGGKEGKEYLILAKERLEILDGDCKIIKELKGKDLAGIEYEPLYPGLFPPAPGKIGSVAERRYPNIYRTTLAPFVTTEEGTGIVHTAVMYGEDDYELGKKLDLPMIHTVDEQGRFIKQLTYLPKSIRGKFVKDAEKDITQDLKKRGLLFKSEMYTHDYPFCWRCKTSLLYYAKKSWFIKMSALRKELLANNEKINWIPSYLKKGRFGKWLEEVKDWAVSRERYWGTPLPIWKCEKCKKVEVIGSREELEGKEGYEGEASKKSQGKDLHRPYIDKITFKCEKCGGEMRRILEVLDCWFDSGAMPFAQYHYPFENKEKIDKGEQYPADFICEAVDQTRGWFYTLLAISTLLGFGTPYRNVISLGHVLDARGRKMSKSRGNIVDPFQALDQFGADVLRWFFYTVNKPQESKNFDPAILRDITSRFVLTVWNSYAFFVTYARIDRPKRIKLSLDNILDRWIFSRLAELNKNIVQYLDAYNVLQAAKAIEKFVDDLSNWYIRRSRRRFWKSGNGKDKQEGYETLFLVLVNLSGMLAPFMPFLAEEIFYNLTGKKSVHLEKFPSVSKKLLDTKINDQMEITRQIVALGLNVRAQAQIKVRQVLSRLLVRRSVLDKLDQDFITLIKEEVNVKEIGEIEEGYEGEGGKAGWIVAKEDGLRVALNTKITPKLKLEGIARDLVRAVQEVRKKAEFEIADRIELGVESEDQEIQKAIRKWKDYIKKETLARKIAKKLDKADYNEAVELDGKEVRIGIRRLG